MTLALLYHSQSFPWPPLVLGIFFHFGFVFCFFISADSFSDRREANVR